jgi:biotin synthase
MGEIVRNIKLETGLAVTLSLGERSQEEIEAWRRAGANRYLLRFETSDQKLFHRIHPGKVKRLRTGGKHEERVGSHLNDRIALLRVLREMGYEIGGGIMVGIPGQSMESVARDIEIFRELDLDMIGVGPFIAHPDTPLGRGSLSLTCDEPVPATEQMVYKVIALARLVRPDANIPSTTALATLNKEQGRELGLARGGNVVMPNLTPPKYRVQYEIYPGKACLHETAEACHGCLQRRIESLGRTVGRGPGGRGQSMVAT